MSGPANVRLADYRLAGIVLHELSSSGRALRLLACLLAQAHGPSSNIKLQLQMIQTDECTDEACVARQVEI